MVLRDRPWTDCLGSLIGIFSYFEKLLIMFNSTDNISQSLDVKLWAHLFTPRFLFGFLCKPHLTAHDLRQIKLAEGSTYLISHCYQIMDHTLPPEIPPEKLLLNNFWGIIFMGEYEIMLHKGFTAVYPKCFYFQCHVFHTSSKRQVKTLVMRFRVFVFLRQCLKYTLDFQPFVLRHGLIL